MPPILIPILIVVAVIAVAALAIYISHLMEKKRTEAMARAAADLNFEFYPKGDPSLTGELSRFYLFGQGHSKQLWNLMRGVAQGLELNIFDYKYVIGSGKHQHVVTQSVFCARRDGMDLTEFTMRPESFWHKVAAVFGYKDINFDSHPGFSKRNLLRGPDEAAIRELFREEILDYFEDRTGLSVEGNGDTLLYYRNKRLKPDGLREFMAEGFAVYKLFAGE